MLSIPFLSAGINRWFKPQNLDDLVDRINYYLTATLLAFFSIMVSAKQYVGSPIQCWTPKEFKGAWDRYAEDYCFIQNTYYIPMNESVPLKDKEIENAEISYYQWVPIVLALQSVMFCLPNFIWKIALPRSGVDINAAVDGCRNLRTVQVSERKSEVENIASYLSEAIAVDNEGSRPTRFARFRSGNGLNSYATILYLCVKALYVVNIVVQFTLLNTFLGHAEGWTWGFSALNNLRNGVDWHTSGIFPRVTLCDFDVRKMGNIHTYTIQCVLMINMFNEKIYIFLWFWFFGLMLVTIVNFMTTVADFLLAFRKDKAIGRFLKGYVDVNEFNSVVRRFMCDALKPDGLLVLRFIENHAGANVAKEITQKLFEDYLEKNQHILYENDDNPKFQYSLKTVHYKR